MKIYSAMSPFVFKPIVQLLEEVGYRPESVYDKLCMCTIDPLNHQYAPFKFDSHLTDAQTKEEQIRYLGIEEIDRKLMYLASQLAPYIEKQPLTFALDMHFQGLNYLSIFIQYLQAYDVPNINVQFTLESFPATYTCEEAKVIEDIYFSDDKTRAKEVKSLLEAAKTCSHSGDYYSAINLLLVLKNVAVTDDWLETEIYLHLALLYRLTEESIKAEFYYNLCVNAGDFRQKNSALYALSMIYLRHHTFKHLNTSKGARYIEEAYQLLLREPDSKRIKVDRVFNRNAFALVQFKEGDVESAERLVYKGIKTLDNIDTRYSKFHQTVLYYNHFQCLVAKKDYDGASKSMNHLISLDPKFFLYHEVLAELYITTGQLEKATNTLSQAINIDKTYSKFYYLMGKIYFLQKDYKSAIIQLKQALVYNPLSMSTLCYLTTIYNLENQYEKTIQLLAHFCLKYHNNTDGEIAFNNMLVALINTNTDPATIKGLANKAYAIRPSSLLIKELITQLSSL